MDHIFLIGKTIDSDLETFFGPILATDQIHRLESADMATVLVLAGIFKSKSQARQNGFKEINPGFSDFRAGKNKTRISILNIR